MQISAYSPCCSTAYQRPQAQPEAVAQEQAKAAEEKENKLAKTNESEAGQNGNQEQKLTSEQQQELKKLEERDREVRAHEAAHKAAAGGLAKGSASYTYQRGPDGKLYAVGGEVSIDTSKVSGDPEATLQKANQIRSAALAPAHPSSQDHAVAAEAQVMAAEARKEMASEQSSAAISKPPPTESHQATEQQAPQTNEHEDKTRHYQEVANSSGEASPPLLDLSA